MLHHPMCLFLRVALAVKVGLTAEPAQTLCGGRVSRRAAHPVRSARAGSGCERSCKPSRAAKNCAASGRRGSFSGKQSPGSLGKKRGKTRVNLARDGRLLSKKKTLFF